MKLFLIFPNKRHAKKIIRTFKQPIWRCLQYRVGSSVFGPCPGPRLWSVNGEEPKKKSAFLFFPCWLEGILAVQTKKLMKISVLNGVLWRRFFGPPYFQLCWFWDLKYINFSQMSKFWVGEMLFYYLDGLSTLKICEKCSKSVHLVMWITLMVKNHSMDTRTIFSIFRAQKGP